VFAANQHLAAPFTGTLSQSKKQFCLLFLRSAHSFQDVELERIWNKRVLESGFSEVQTLAVWFDLSLPGIDHNL
jgi:hypothetical protein